ncbi:MAG: Uracil-DNA glycosylase, family 5 [Ignavibacteriae bacterium]|nr:MAG: Uracil-DNA glycosylase, family 5 [Ignavibacteriota bacterium]
MYTKLEDINQNILDCRKCSRILNWIKIISQTKTRRYKGQTYWAKPVPSFGDPEAELLIVGLAPAAHGANRTGRMFTGDRSGMWLYKALYNFGFSNKPESIGVSDGLQLSNCWITAAIHCAPPSNKPNKEEILNCNEYLLNEILLLENLKIILALGKIAFDATLFAIQEANWVKETKTYKFSHGAMYNLTNGKYLLASYHPSQQNTFTGKLTQKMFDKIFSTITDILNKEDKNG